MTHHVMNQMGHEFPNMVGMKPGDLDEKIRPLLPAYMTHGQNRDGHGEDGEIMPYPRNTIAMKARRDRSGIISRWAACSRSSRFAIAESYERDPGWYQHPPGTVAVKASDAELARDGINVNEPVATGRW